MEIELEKRNRAMCKRLGANPVDRLRHTCSSTNGLHRMAFTAKRLSSQLQA